ncbi:E3 ubiquitin-protein ligase SINA-like 2 [Raphanus sativus]|nr:E3 ubiquitin-protein ligase SINA-like 2 [Raphanus sativus]
MERVLEAIIVPCPNAKHGCTHKFSYGKSWHTRRNAGSVYATVLHQAAATPDSARISTSLPHAYHLDTWKGFTCGENEDAWVEISERFWFFRSVEMVRKCFEVEQGVYVTVNYIAPCAPGVSEFSFQLSYSVYGAAARSMPFGLGEMNRIQKVSFQTPDKDFISVPNYFLAGRTTLKMSICINRKKKKKIEDVG